MHLTFTIQRFNPEVHSTSHSQEFRLEVGRGMTVLDALIGISHLRLLRHDDQRQRKVGLPNVPSQRA
jgi:succinate dehydrogenase/fumarate reductase-like Fe-S protein